MITLAESQKITSVAQFRRKRLFSARLLVAVVIYMIYIFFAFDMDGLAKRAKFENAATLAADSWSHKEHMTISRRNQSITYTVEGERKSRYPDGTQPDWGYRRAGRAECQSGGWQQC